MSGRSVWERFEHWPFVREKQDEGPMLETLDYTIRIGSIPTILYFDLYLYSAYAAYYVYFTLIFVCPCETRVKILLSYKRSSTRSQTLLPFFWWKLEPCYSKKQSCFFLLLSVDGGYGPFGNWSSCSATCGGGNTTRTRSCSNPIPAMGGKDCSPFGPPVEVMKCNEQKCPSKTEILIMTLT